MVRNTPDAANRLEVEGRLATSVKVGDPYEVYSLAVGDPVDLGGFVVLQRLDQNRYRLETTGDVTLLVPQTRRGLKISYTRRDGQRVAAERLARDEGFYIPVRDLIAGRTEIVVDRSSVKPQAPSAQSQPDDRAVRKRRFGGAGRPKRRRR